MPPHRSASSISRSSTAPLEMGELEPDDVDMADAAQAAIYKTAQVLLNKVIYTDSYCG